MLEIRGLDVAYGDLRVVRGVSLRVAGGETVALLGPNGAGKTTILRAVHGLVTPAAGTVVLEGRLLGPLPPHARVALGLALVPEGRELFPAMSVEDNLLLGHAAAGGSGAREALARAYDLFPALAPRRRQPAGTLSGGEQQMLAVARALVAAPRLLMLDEPSLGLAPQAVDALYEVLAGLRRRGVTMLLVEQRVGEALGLVDRGYVLEGGRIALEGSAADLRSNPHVRRTYLAF